MLDKLKYTPESREKKAFYASDVGKSLLDLYFAFKGVKQTNPPNWWDTLKWGAGSGVEEALLKILKASGIVDKEYDQRKNGRIEIEREGIRINGYIDAMTIDGFPIEIKSINNANRFDVMKYEKGLPREGYVGQLGIYMDALGVDKGYLMVSSIDGLHRFCFEAKKEVIDGEVVITCEQITVNLTKVYRKWHDLYTNNVMKDTPPDIFENMYKIPVTKVNWSDLSKTDISKARNDKKVIGDWAVLYSPWKDLIIKLQGDTPGYTTEELAYIKDITKGFSNW